MPPIIPNISIDCVVFGFDQNQLNILLTKRELIDDNTGKSLFVDYTLLGHHVLIGENLDEAATRVLKDKTGLDNIYLEQFHTFSDTGRMQRERDKIWAKSMKLGIADHVVSTGYFSLVDSSKVKPDKQHQDSSWFPVHDLPELAFDHKSIIDAALLSLRKKIKVEPIAFKLLPDKFILSELQKLFEAVLGTIFDRRNFRKKVAQMKFVIALDEKRKGGAHKPAQVFIFSQDVYERTKKEKIIFSI